MDTWSASQRRYSRGLRRRNCSAAASVARQAKRLPYKMIREASLCAFFERSRFTAQIGQNFASEMQ